MNLLDDLVQNHQLLLENIMYSAETVSLLMLNRDNKPIRDEVISPRFPPLLVQLLSNKLEMFYCEQQQFNWGFMHISPVDLMWLTGWYMGR